MFTTMDCIDRNTVKQAFERAKSEVTVPDTRFILVGEEHYDQTLAFIRDHFMSQEPIGKGLNLQWSPEQEAFYLDMLRHNLTLALVHQSTGEIIATLVVYIIHKKEQTFDGNAIQDEAFRRLLHYNYICDMEANFFNHYNVEEAFHLTILAVREEYQRQGIAKKLFTLVINMLHYIVTETKAPIYLKAEASSNWTRKIFQQLDFEQIHVSPFDSYKIDGEAVIKNTGVHTYQDHYGLCLVK